jgi:hypothetical protein
LEKARQRERAGKPKDARAVRWRGDEFDLEALIRHGALSYRTPRARIVNI